MYVVGLTGGIGSGKSTVANAFAELGIELVDADLIAREVVEPGQPALQRIAEHFGPAVLNPDHSLDRAALRALIFDQPAERRWLEHLLHPLIRQLTVSRLQAARSPYALLVSPLLLETDQHLLTDHILVVDVPEAVQIERTMARDGNSLDQVQSIIAAQCPRQQRLDRGQSVIDNSGPAAAISEAVLNLDKQFRQLAAAAKDH